MRDKDLIKLAVCGIRHESNSFSTLRTELENFHIQRGEEIVQDEFWKSFDGVEWFPALVARASPHGLVSKDAYLNMKEELISRLNEGLPVDGIYMSLHGAMEVEEIGDGESDLVGSVREAVGPDVPITASLDLHGNIAPAFAESANVLTAMRTSPHVDGYETRRRAVEHLIRCAKGEIKPANVLVKLPLILPGEFTVTEIEPARSLYARLRDIESQPGILDASILIGCAWTDSPYTSVSVIVVAEKDTRLAHDYATALACEIWSQRENFGTEVETASVEEAIEKAMKEETRPVVVSDSGDNVTAGGAGDVPIFLEKLLAAGAKDAVVAGLTDPDAVKLCVQKGVGSRVTVEVGGKLDKINGYPLEVEGIVERVKPSSLAVLRIEGVRVILASDRRAFTELNSFEDAGVYPLEQQIIVVKVGLLFSQIRDIAGKAIMALSPGFTNLLLKQLPYKRVRRPIFPLDEDLELDDIT